MAVESAIVVDLSERAVSSVPSPCVRNCCLHPQTDVCLGCHRSLEEIIAWHDASDAQRLEILACAAARRDAARSDAIGMEAPAAR